jgi:hypothetical protein
MDEFESNKQKEKQTILKVNKTNANPFLCLKNDKENSWQLMVHTCNLIYMRR